MEEEIVYLALGQFSFTVNVPSFGDAGLPNGVEFVCPVYKTGEEAQKAIDDYLGGNGTVLELKLGPKDKPIKESIEENQKGSQDVKESTDSSNGGD